jgi:hypothetical protein
MVFDKQFVGVIAIAAAAAAAANPASAPLGAAAAATTLSSGALTLVVTANGSYSLTVRGEEPVHGHTLSVFVNDAEHTLGNGGLQCTAATARTGIDQYGSYSAVDLR